MSLVEEGTIDLILLDIWPGDNIHWTDRTGESEEALFSTHHHEGRSWKISKRLSNPTRSVFDFVEKPLTRDKVILAIANGLRYTEQQLSSFTVAKKRL